MISTRLARMGALVSLLSQIATVVSCQKQDASCRKLDLEIDRKLIPFSDRPPSPVL